MRETPKRALSGLIYVILLTTATLYSSDSFYLFFGLLMVLCVFEFCKLIHLKPEIPVLLSIALYAMNIWQPQSDLNIFVLLIATLIVSFGLLKTLFENKTLAPKKPAKYLITIGYIILPFILIGEIARMGIEFSTDLIICVFVIIWANDSMAYLIGKKFGRRKLFERVSPKKTIEGFLGGLAGALLAGGLLSVYFIDKSIPEMLIFSLITSIFGTFGDLIESKFKRNANVKDSGKIMPGHGGMLDRLDSVIFAVPFIVLYIQILSYVS
jgi:phosphatidate cytidylyltransferase